MSVNAFLEVTLGIDPTAENIGPRTVVAVPPSSLNPVADEIWVYVGGRRISRAYDPELEQP